MNLSPSTLNLLVECPHCFWLHFRRGIIRPRGPSPSIAIGVDLAAKAYFDQYRGKDTMPPLLSGKIPGKLAVTLPKWLVYEKPGNTYKIIGKIDELAEVSPGTFAVIDHKTRDKLPEEVHKAHQLQMDVYTWLLEHNGWKTNRMAYLVYYLPGVFTDQGTPFVVDVKAFTTDPVRGKSVYEQALEVLSRDEPPPSHELCEYCIFAKKHSGDYVEKAPTTPQDELPF